LGNINRQTPKIEDVDVKDRESKRKNGTNQKPEFLKRTLSPSPSSDQLSILGRGALGAYSNGVRLDFQARWLDNGRMIVAAIGMPWLASQKRKLATQCVTESRRNRIRPLWLLVTDRFGRTVGKRHLSRAVGRPYRGPGSRCRSSRGRDGKPSTLRDTAVTDPRFEPRHDACRMVGHSSPRSGRDPWWQGSLPCSRDLGKC
jgi:hypothetical protein